VDGHAVMGTHAPPLLVPLLVPLLAPPPSSPLAPLELAPLLAPLELAPLELPGPAPSPAVASLPPPWPEALLDA